MTTTITICDTCKTEDWDETSGRTDGEALATLIEDASQDVTNVVTRRVSCIMGCKRACNIAVQADGKLSYVLGEFAANAEAASAIVDYATAHAASETGQVPFRDWPQGIKGHFTARITPLP